MPNFEVFSHNRLDSLGESLRTHLAERKSWERPLHPIVLKVDPTTEAAKLFLTLRTFALKAPQASLAAIEGSPGIPRDIRSALLAEAICSDIEVCQLYDPMHAASLMDDEKYAAHAFKISILSGNLPNACSLARYQLVRRGEESSSEDIHSHLLSVVCELLQAPDIPSKEMIYLGVLGRFLEAGGVLSIHRVTPEAVSASASSEYSTFVADVTSRFGLRADEILRAFPEKVYSLERDKVQQIATLAGERLPQLSRCLVYRRTQPSLEDLLALHHRWGEEAWGFVRAHEGKALAFATEFEAIYQRVFDRLLLDESDDLFGASVGAITDRLLRQSPAHIDAVIENAKAYQHSNFAGLLTQVDTILTPVAVAAIARHSKYYAESGLQFIAELVHDLDIQSGSSKADELSEFIVAIAPHVGINLAEFFKALTAEQYQESAKQLKTLAEQYGKLASALLAQLKGEPLKELSVDPLRVRAFKQFFGDSASVCFSYCPQDRAPSEIYQRWGKSAGFIYRELGEDFEGKLSDDNTAKILANRKEFGLTALHRYVRANEDSIDCSILEENLLNLDPLCKRDLPIALVVFGRDCHNDALAAHSSELFRLRNRYKLFAAEVGSTAEFIAMVRKVGLLHGADDKGNPVRPIDFMAIHAHGYREFVGWREFASLKHIDRSLDGPLMVSEHGEVLMDRVGNMMSRDGLGILTSCEGAFGGPEANNPLRNLKNSLNNAIWEGVRRSAAAGAYIFDQTDKVVGVRFDCAKRKIVRLS